MKDEQQLKELIELIKDRAYYGQTRLSSGAYTQVYLDLKHALADGESLNLSINVLLDHVVDHVSWKKITAFGGPTMGADMLSHSIVSHYDYLKWFSLREPKDHGMGKTIEGAFLGPDDHVIITDDVVNTGGSLLKAYGQVVATGAKVGAIVPLVDRGGVVERAFKNIGALYIPVLSYKDLDLPSMGSA